MHAVWINFPLYILHYFILTLPTPQNCFKHFFPLLLISWKPIKLSNSFCFVSPTGTRTQLALGGSDESSVTWNLDGLCHLQDVFDVQPRKSWENWVQAPQNRGGFLRWIHGDCLHFIMNSNFNLVLLLLPLPDANCLRLASLLAAAKFLYKQLTVTFLFWLYAIIFSQIIVKLNVLEVLLGLREYWKRAFPRFAMAYGISSFTSTKPRPPLLVLKGAGENKVLQ